jgi:hypothetical protein
MWYNGGEWSVTNMPYALKNKTTSELFSCALRNVYDLPYHGVKLWADREEAEAEADAFLTERGVENPADWEIVSLDEHQAKLCNVRLGNNPKKRVYLAEDGGIVAQSDAT